MRPPASPRSPGWIWPVLASLAGCGAGDGEQILVTVPIPRAAAPASPAEAPLPAGIPLPAAEACVLSTDDFAGDETLFLSRNGGPFAITSAGQAAVLHVPLGAAGRTAVLQVDAASASVQGYLDPPLYLSRPTLVAGALSPLPTTRLELRAAARVGDEVQLTMALPLDPSIELLGEDAMIRGDCDSVSPTPLDFDVRGALSLGETHASASLHRDRVTPLYFDPREAPRALLRPARDVGVEVLEASADFTRIAWTRADVVVLGWVSARDLGPALFTPTESERRPRETRTWGAGGIHEIVVCPHDVPLIAVSSGHKRTVGSLRAGGALGVGSRHGPLTPVSAMASPIDADPRARWLVPTSDLAVCRRVQ